MDAKPQIIFSGQYSYRKSGSLLGGCIALACGSFALTYLGRGIYHDLYLRAEPWSLKIVGACLFLGGIGGLMTYAGLYLLFQCLLDREIPLEFSMDGIQYGKAFYAWEDIEWFGGYAYPKGYLLACRLRGKSTPIRLDLTPNLICDEYDNLMDTLYEKLGERYPEVDFD